jgi:hypothetical protein
MLVSTFELLTKPIAPPQPNVPIVVARTAVQGYFLTIANTSDSLVRLKLQFTATTPSLTIAETVTILDVKGIDEFGEIAPVTPKKSIYFLTIPANDTALVTLLPDLNNPAVITEKSLEVRGYVEIFLAAPANKSVDLLLTPEHRGTFLPADINAPTPDFDQLVYALPTPKGGSLFTLTKTSEPAATPVPLGSM